MLVLSRKTNESIIVDDIIEIVVVEVRGNRVRLGVNAPREMPIVRSEIEHQDVEVHCERRTHCTTV